MANFSLTRKNISDDVKSALKLGTKVNALINRTINKVVNDIYLQDDFEFTWDREIVQTVIDITAGTVSISAGGTTVTGVSTAFAAADVGKFIQFSSSNDWYKISAVASATSATIEIAYTQSSALSGGTYIIRKFFYEFTSNADKYVVVKQAITPVKLQTMRARRFDSLFPFSEASGDPRAIIPVHSDTVGTIQFMLFPTPSAVINLEVRFKKKATTLDSDSATPPMPGKYHNIVYLGAIYMLSHYAGKDASQISLNFRIYKDALAQMVEQEAEEPDWAPRLKRNDEGTKFDDFQPITGRILDGT